MSPDWYGSLTRWPNTRGFEIFLLPTFVKMMTIVIIHESGVCLISPHTSLAAVSCFTYCTTVRVPCFCKNKRLHAEQLHFKYCFHVICVLVFSFLCYAARYWFYFIFNLFIITTVFSYISSVLYCIRLLFAVEKLNFPKEIISFLPPPTIQLLSQAISHRVSY